MGLFKKITKGIGGLFKKKKKKDTALGAAVSAAAFSLTGIAGTPAKTKTPDKKNGWDFLDNLLNKGSDVVGDLKNGPSSPLIDLNKWVKLPSVQVEASEKQNRNLLLIGGAAVLIYLFTRKRNRN